MIFNIGSIKHTFMFTKFVILFKHFYFSQLGLFFSQSTIFASEREHKIPGLVIGGSLFVVAYGNLIQPKPLMNIADELWLLGLGHAIYSSVDIGERFPDISLINGMFA